MRKEEKPLPSQAHQNQRQPTTTRKAFIMISEWWMKSQAQDDGKSIEFFLFVVVAIARNK